MTTAAKSPEDDNADHIHAGTLPPWTVGELPPSPARGWRRWLNVIGPGVLLAGASIGTGEWIFGPGITAQYGGTLLWLATLSILGQVFANLEMIRYTLYCGEPIMVGFFRSWPGPRLWTFCYALLEFGSIWPFNVASAAVVLTAALLGHLPRDSTVNLMGVTLDEIFLVKILSYVLFLLAFLPLIFGGTIYKMLLRIFTVKLVGVLVYLTVFCLLMVSAASAWEVVSGFFRFGKLPLRADTVIADGHFTFLERDGPATYVVKGTMEGGEPQVIEFIVRRGDESKSYKQARGVPADLLPVRDRLRDEAATIAMRGGFFVQNLQDGTTIRIEGTVNPDRHWQATRITVADAAGERRYSRLEDVPEPYAATARALTVHQGVEEINVVTYWRQHGDLPNLDWAMVAAFVAIAGAGGLANTMYSSFARDKGWGMGARVGAIPSLIGGKTITLSHVGEAFRPNEENRPRWRGWKRYILEDQLVVWMFCNFLGMALPCMLSLEFIRHAPVTGERVAAMTANGMALRYPDYSHLLWYLTLFCGFLVLYPGQILSGDIISRRWTDIIWTASARARRLEGHQVIYVYYSILLLYCIWGLIALTLFDPLIIAKIGAGLQNVSLGFATLHTLYVNRTLLPRELQPNWFMQLGTLLCGTFFIGISVTVLLLI